MTQTLAQLFGAGASLSGTTLTINLSNFTTLSDSTPSATQIAATLLHHWATTTTTLTDDDTAGIVAATFQPDKAFVTRNDVAQIEEGFTINTYRADNTPTFDPDDVV